MRLLLLCVGLWFASLAGAAGLAGTYVLQGQQGPVVAKIEVRGTSLTGSIDLAGQGTMVLTGAVAGNRAHGTVSSQDGSGTFEAAVKGDVLDLTIAQEDGPNQRAARLPLQFQRVQPSAATPGAPKDSAGDARLVGNWVYQNIMVSGDASMASEEYLAFRANGTYFYGKGRSVAGGGNWSWDGGSGQVSERGRWRADDSKLFILGPDGQWKRLGAYGMTTDGSTMRITYEGGRRKLWSRQ
jgi:hypothetical protein